MALAMAAVTFTSCEDVPAPYDYPGTGGGGSTTEGVYLNQSFAKDLGDFKSFGTNDNIAWTIDYSSACITGYKDFNGDGTKTNEAGVTYLVSPEIDLTKASKAYIEMNHAMKYERADVNANNTLLISKDYTDDPTKATWTPIAYPTTGLNDASTKEFVFVTSAANIPAEFIGQKVRIAFRHTCTDKQSSTWEIKTLSVKEGEVENGGSEVTPTPTPGEGTGEGTEASPYDVTKALAIITSGNIPASEVYVSGIVSSISEIETANYGNATYNISVDGTTTSEQLIVYHGFYLGGEKFTSNDQLKVGDKVVVYGKLKQFYEKKEIDYNNKIVSLNGKKAETGGGTTPGGEEKPGGGEAGGEEKPGGGAVEGNTLTANYGNATYNISVDGTTTSEQLIVYHGFYLGGEKFTSNDQLKVGDKVVVYGKLKQFYEKKEIDYNNKIVSLNGKKAETGGGTTPGGEEKPGGGEAGGEEKPGGGAVEGNTLTVEASAMGIENGTAMPTITLTDGTKLTFDAGGNQNAPKYYNAGTNIRMYPKNSMTITATKNIEKVEFVVDVYSGVTYNASGDVSAEPGKVEIQDTNIIISGISGKSTKFTNTSTTTGAASQVRIKTIKITYAK